MVFFQLFVSFYIQSVVFILHHFFPFLPWQSISRRTGGGHHQLDEVRRLNRFQTGHGSVAHTDCFLMHFSAAKTLIVFPALSTVATEINCSTFCARFLSGGVLFASQHPWVINSKGVLKHLFSYLFFLISRAFFIFPNRAFEVNLCSPMSNCSHSMADFWLCRYVVVAGILAFEM